MKNTQQTLNFTLLTALAAATMLTAGCHPAPIAHGENFMQDGAETCTGRMAQAQTAAGAKNDATLYDQSFHGPELNSLGQGKLDLILKATPAGDPVFVYLNMPHDQVALRQSAVDAYLKTAGVSPEKIIVADGTNPNNNTPSAYNIAGLYKSEGTSVSGAAVIDSSGGPAAGGSGAAGH